MPHRGRTTAILLATGAVVVLVLGVVVWFRSDLEKIQGRWKVVSVTGDDKAGPKLDHMVFEDRTLRLVRDNGSTEIVSYHLDEAHQPRWFDWIFIGGNVKGIYDLTGDALRLCLNSETGERPITFEAKPGDGLIVAIYKRE